MRLIVCFSVVMGLIGGLGLGSAAAQSESGEVTDRAEVPDAEPEKALGVNPKAGFDVEAAQERDKGKHAGSGRCVIAKPTQKRIKAVLDYVKASLAGASAPEDLDIRLSFQKDKVLLNLVRESKSPAEGENESFPFHWKLPEGCKGDVAWKSTLAPDAPTWVRTIQSQGFARGLPIHPKTVSAFAGDSYGSTGRGAAAARGGADDGTGNSIWLVGVLVGMGCVVLRRFL